MNERGIYISPALDGIHYVAERSHHGRRHLLWSAIRIELNQPDTPIATSKVPYHIRRQAYRRLHPDDGR